jgi:hypothetical protein
MKTSKYNSIKLILFKLMFVFTLNYEGMCAQGHIQDGCFEDFEHFAQTTRRSAPIAINTAACTLGAVSGLHELTQGVGRALCLSGAGVSFFGAALNTYNWIVDRDSIKGFTHNFFNAAIIASNTASAVCSILSTSTEDQNQSSAYGTAASILGFAGLAFKATDLYLTSSPSDIKLKRQTTSSSDDNKNVDIIEFNTIKVQNSNNA